MQHRINYRIKQRKKKEINIQIKEVPKGGPPWQGRNVSLTVEDSIRVPVDLLNELMNLASELC